MNRHENIKKFKEIYEHKIDMNSIEYDGRNFLFILNSNVFNEDLEVIRSIFHETEHLIGNKISIKLNSSKIKNFQVFFKIEDYLKKYNNYSRDFDISELLILEENNKLILKKSNEKFSKAKSIIYNNHSYQLILNLLRSNPVFSSIKSDNNEIIIVSKENSVIHIGYKNYDLRIGELEDLFPDFLWLKKRFEKRDLSDRVTDNSEFIKLFVETISTAGIGNYDLNDRFFEIIKGLKIIISLTERDYDNYINNFSFEKIKSKFKEERNKYFENLEKNIDLISKQVASFPLTFAATAFASYQVKDKPWILALIFLGYLLYTLIAIRILGITDYNIDCLEKDINKEEDNVKNSYSKNHNDFEDDFEKIRTKTKKIKDLMNYIRFILCSMLILFFGYSTFQIYTNNSDKIAPSLLIPIEKIKYICIDTLDKNYDLNEFNKNNKSSTPYIQMKSNLNHSKDTTLNKQTERKK